MENQGLTTLRAQSLLKQYGLNLLPQRQKGSAFKLFTRQFQNGLSWLLIIASLLSFLVGDRLDGLLILTILILNAALGFWQEYKASKELEALRKLEVLTSRVIRDGKQQEIPASQIVPEDLVFLEAGDKIPADGRLTLSVELAVNESSLTGESLPVVKSTGSENNQVYFGTIVTSGHGKFIVEATGAKTKFGAIALTLSEVEDEVTPLEKALSSFSKGIAIAAIIIALAIFSIRVWQGYEILDVFFGSIALMVAAVPEGLPTVVTIVLALGVKKMHQHKASIRKMVAVESLGSATVICTDKTGTLTRNEMRVKSVEAGKDDLDQLMKCAVLCSSATLVVKEGGFDILGDTTEGALLIWAHEKGIDINKMRSLGKILEEDPFSLKTRMMSVVWQEDGKSVLYAKGAPEAILPKTNLSKKEQERLTGQYEAMAAQGLRVLGFGFKQVDIGSSEVGNLHFLGFVGIADAPRVEVKEALEKANQAGIRVVMVTGDNELTAKAIAEEVGLIKEGEEILTGAQLGALTDEELNDRLGKIRIFARIDPELKLRIVKAYQRSGEVVAVTGDGVNDSLALKQAHVGVAMGKSGTDVAKEASDIILLDDNFATLVTAIEEGRLIFSNILKSIKFLLTGNFSEVLLIVGAAVLALPTPLLPAQILWINFVTDGFPALALGTDKASSNLMRIPPRRNSVLLGNGMIWYILIGGSLIGLTCLTVFYLLLASQSIETARSTVFTLLVVLQMILVFVIRRHHAPWSNKNLLLAVGFALLMQVLILTVEPLRELFKL